jgi:hypothetical protein
MTEAAKFFVMLLESDIQKICVENPVPHGYALLPKYTQIIHPYFFGDNVQKRTCLWLKNLPKLMPTNVVDKGKKYINKRGKSNGTVWYQCNPDWKHRSRTFQGIADAMAEQWG